jgi:hypothetical protein
MHYYNSSGEPEDAQCRCSGAPAYVPRPSGPATAKSKATLPNGEILVELSENEDETMEGVDYTY